MSEIIQYLQQTGQPAGIFLRKENDHLLGIECVSAYKDEKQCLLPQQKTMCEMFVPHGVAQDFQEEIINLQAEVSRWRQKYAESIGGRPVRVAIEDADHEEGERRGILLSINPVDVRVLKEGVGNWATERQHMALVEVDGRIIEVSPDKVRL